MKFYVDFEATQFSERIISIGCVAENGQTFKTLVQPVNGEKVNEFITKLTGITNEDLETAPTADEAFTKFYDWVQAMTYSQELYTMPEFFCYGDCDKRFVKKTMKYMTSIVAYVFAVSLTSLMVDYSSSVKDYFHAKSRIGLKRIYNLLLAEETEQSHDALEDALMLRYVADNLEIKATPEDFVNLPPVDHNPEIKAPKVKAPAIFLEWPASPKNMFKADTKADSTNWKVCAIAPNNTTKYFDSMETACLWIIKYLIQGRSPRKKDDLRHVEKRIINNTKDKSDNRYCGFKWIIKEDEE